MYLLETTLTVFIGVISVLASMGYLRTSRICLNTTGAISRGPEKCRPADVATRITKLFNEWIENHIKIYANGLQAAKFKTLELRLYQGDEGVGCRISYGDGLHLNSVFFWCSIIVGTVGFCFIIIYIGFSLYELKYAFFAYVSQGIMYLLLAVHLLHHIYVCLIRQQNTYVAEMVKKGTPISNQDNAPMQSGTEDEK